MFITHLENGKKGIRGTKNEIINFAKDLIDSVECNWTKVKITDKALGETVFYLSIDTESEE